MNEWEANVFAWMGVVVCHSRQPTMTTKRSAVYTGCMGGGGGGALAERHCAIDSGAEYKCAAADLVRIEIAVERCGWIVEASVCNVPATNGAKSGVVFAPSESVESIRCECLHAVRF